MRSIAEDKIAKALTKLERTLKVEQAHRRSFVVNGTGVAGIVVLL